MPGFEHVFVCLCSISCTTFVSSTRIWGLGRYLAIIDMLPRESLAVGSFVKLLRHNSQ